MTSAPANPSGVTGILSNWVHDTQTSSIPPAVIERAKYLILDGIACGLVSAHLPWSETAAKAILKVEPPGECTVFGWGEQKLGPSTATLLNSTFIQGFELDDFHSKAPLHSNSLLLPSLFAASEALTNGKATSGSDFLRAYIIGTEVGPRVGLALHGADLLSRGWHSGTVMGPSAVAAAVSSLLHLSPQQIEWAFGHACTQAGGLMAAQFGSMAKRMQHGFAARNGLLAVALAQENYTGIEEVYERPYGGFLSCFGQGITLEPQTLPQEIVKGLGEEWEIGGVRVKQHAAMGALQSTIDCLEVLQKKHKTLFADQNLSNIDEVKVEVSKPAFEHGGFIAPPDKPLSTVAAQMSLQYAAAAQLIDHEVLMAQFGADRLHRSEVIDLMHKVRPVHNEELDRNKNMGYASITTIKFRDGTKVSETMKSFKGMDPETSNEDIVAKWRSLVRDAVDDDRRDSIEKCVLGLESLEDVRELAKLLQDTVKCPIVV